MKKVMYGLYNVTKDKLLHFEVIKVNDDSVGYTLTDKLSMSQGPWLVGSYKEALIVFNSTVDRDMSDYFTPVNPFLGDEEIVVVKVRMEYQIVGGKYED